MIEKNIEINNAKQEIEEIVEKCNCCGLCKELDPVFKILKEEPVSPRGRAILFSNHIFEKNVFESPLPGLCKISCPFKIDIDEAIRKARLILNLRGKENEENKKILNKIIKKENPFKQL